MQGYVDVCMSVIRNEDMGFIYQLKRRINSHLDNMIPNVHIRDLKTHVCLVMCIVPKVKGLRGVQIRN